MNHCDICDKLTTTRTEDGIRYCGRCWALSYPEDIATVLADLTGLPTHPAIRFDD